MATTPAFPIDRPTYSLREHEIFVSLEEYLRTGYDPDMDYVDGHLEERNLGETEHSRLQGALLKAFLVKERDWQIRVYPECRLQVRADRFRVPDILILPRISNPSGIVREAPLLCIEVLSPEDTMRRILYRVDDYAAMGVANVWVLDPEYRRVFVVTQGERRWIEERVLTVAGTQIRVDLDAIAADLAD